MNAIKTTYESLPEFIHMPKEFIHHKAEIIILIDDNDEKMVGEKPTIASFFGCLPDFPERDNQGNFESREML